MPTRWISKKAITGQLIPDGDHGPPALTLLANPQSGHDRPATRGISTLNLLRQGQLFPSVNITFRCITPN